MWFDALTGFDETAVDDVAAQFVLSGKRMTSLANGRVFEVDPANAGALFQVASQFNTLEMISPSVTPEMGISRYYDDRTQGPACAISCGAATIYRNYLVPIDGGIGQRADRQISCLDDLAGALGVEVAMRNGYALPTSDVLASIAAAIDAASAKEIDDLRSTLRIGLHTDTEVTIHDAGHTVAQAFCSALPVAYSSQSSDEWEPFARLVLEAAYEATMAAALVNAMANAMVNAMVHAETTGNRTVFLTMLGGGAFGNRQEWILDAVERSLGLVADSDLEVLMVSHGSPNPALQPLTARFSASPL